MKNLGYNPCNSVQERLARRPVACGFIQRAAGECEAAINRGEIRSAGPLQGQSSLQRGSAARGCCRRQP
jgi:hypothetical protein